jgi:competence protein ComEC
VLCAAVIALVVVSPPLALTAGFALSVLATAGLVLLAPILRRWLAGAAWSRSWPGFAQDALAVTLAAQAGALPVLLLMGAAVGWVSVPANLLAMPAVPPVTILGLGAAALGPVWPASADVIAAVAVVPAAWIAVVAYVFADLPGLPPLPVAMGVLLLGSALVARRAGRWTRIGLIAGGTAITVAGVALPRPWPPPGWIVLMCDVGQGSALLLNAAPGAAVLVDAGPDPPLVDRCLDEAGVGSLPAVVLTHYHRDHVGGLDGALRGRSVGEVLATAVRDPPEQAREVDAALADLGLAVIPVAAGDSRTAGSVAWRTLWPRRMLSDGPNNASLVLVASVDGHLVLLPGDIERAAQVAVLPDVPDIDVALVPHHGSADLLPGFAAATRAEIALLSVGADNPFGHPAPDAVAEWSGALLARTDLHGDVAVVADDRGLSVVVRRGMLPPWQPG